MGGTKRKLVRLTKMKKLFLAAVCLLLTGQAFAFDWGQPKPVETLKEATKAYDECHFTWMLMEGNEVKAQDVCRDKASRDLIPGWWHKQDMDAISDMISWCYGHRTYCPRHVGGTPRTAY